MYVCIHMRICVCMYVCVRACMHAHVFCTYACMRTHACMHACMHASLYTCVCMHECIYVYTRARSFAHTRDARTKSTVYEAPNAHGRAARADARTRKRTRMPATTLCTHDALAFFGIACARKGACRPRVAPRTPTHVHRSGCRAGREAEGDRACSLLQAAMQSQHSSQRLAAGGTQTHTKHVRLGELLPAQRPSEEKAQLACALVSPRQMPAGWFCGQAPCALTAHRRRTPRVVPAPCVMHR